ncbi:MULTISPECIES: aspartate aminotransferase family protein [unclassified Leisingera]|uniref:aspartate aminotransferase family protein n=1 Tax=unclassified Leisingera TaxID=2614906 RepID=UPI0010127634|nr:MULTISPECIES: aspartate aminotransferase family protein [unclassified Leisingera]MBQ4825586.1 aspartate aminotransferase family protein [Leisingera sp. HS039]MCF6430748.1 aspartate aminotransferase family protein [Leisingera sp. MMG026]QAX31558.1 aspartate aminotransferase family protein [Leisingera sp. NJS204]QBR37969.1 aspartate aminotransferase family protein [Leisingera sp. NJS201]UWQ74872.1 aspartate aminotransferase family protein [Leisingera sp. M658]
MTVITNHMPTAELQALDAAHHMHPFTANGELSQKGARIITRADGVHLTDSEGNRILDAMAGLWCVNIGYGRDELAEVAARQMRELPYYNTFFQTTHVPAIALAAKIAELAPGDLNNVFFAGSGSEANDTNIRMVRHYWALKGKPAKSVIISRKNGYHGSSVGSGSLGGMSGMHAQGGMPIPDIHHINQPHWWAEGGDMPEEEFGLQRARELEEAILELGEDRVAAFIAEPVQGAGGVIVPPDSYWPEIQRICDKYEILLIADEVICGFGRTGNWFGSETLNIRPDIMTIAKGLSSGYAPIGGSIVSDEVASVIAGDEFNHGYTYSGHPVAAAVALENLRIMEEENILGHVRDVAAPYLKQKWEALADHPLVGEARIAGMMGSIALTPDKATRAGFAAEAGTVGYICRERCFANNLVMRHVGDRMIISPPLVITPAEIDVLIERASKSLDECYAELKAQDLLHSA